MTRDQFVDLCVLIGCDYLGPIPKLVPHTALKAIDVRKAFLVEEFPNTFSLAST